MWLAVGTHISFGHALSDHRSSSIAIVIRMLCSTAVANGTLLRRCDGLAACGKRAKVLISM